MKAMNVQQTHSLKPVITRLVLLGGVVLGCLYAFLYLCSTALKILE